MSGDRADEEPRRRPMWLWPSGGLYDPSAVASGFEPGAWGAFCERLSVLAERARAGAHEGLARALAADRAELGRMEQALAAEFRDLAIRATDPLLWRCIELARSPLPTVYIEYEARASGRGATFASRDVEGAPCARCDHGQRQHLDDGVGACCQPDCKCPGFVAVVPQDGPPANWPAGWPRPVAGAHVARRGRSLRVTNPLAAVEAALAASLAAAGSPPGRPAAARRRSVSAPYRGGRGRFVVRPLERLVLTAAGRPVPGVSLGGSDGRMLFRFPAG